jgi:hypothetical protein
MIDPKIIVAIDTYDYEDAMALLGSVKSRAMQGEDRKCSF